MGIFIKDAKEVKSIFAAVPFMDVNEFSLHGKATQKTTSGKNLLKYPYQFGTQTIKGVTFTVNDDDGSVSVKGKNDGTGTSDFFLIGSWGVKNNIDLVPKEDLIISGIDAQANTGSQKISIRTYTFDGNGTKIDGVLDYGDSVKLSKDLITPASGIAVYIVVNSGATVDTVVYPMIRLASITDDAYEPYTNGASPNPDYPQEIDVAGESGSVTVKSVGKNLLKITATSQTINGVSYVFNEDGSVTTDGTATANTFVQIGYIYDLDINSKYILSGCPYNGGVEVCRLDIRGSDGLGVLVNQSDGEREFTPKENTHTCYIRLGKGLTVNNFTFKPMVRLATETDSTYEPHKEITVTLQTPNGLAGIPVSSGGNYTDQSGQQWICDEIVKYADGTGERIQRVEKYNITGNENWQLSTSITNSFYCNAISSKVKRPSVASEKPILKCSHFMVVQSNKMVDLCVSVNIYGNLFIRYDDVFTSVDAVKTWLSTNNVVVLYELVTPIRTPLTAEEIAEIEKLAAVYPANNVSVSDDCNLSLLIGKRYETKKIVSAWANKDGVPVKVFSGEMKPRFVMAGAYGSTYYSSDGENWLPMDGLDSTDKYYSLTYGNEKFVCIGQNGGVYQLSQNSKKWKQVSSLTIEKSYSNGLAYGDGLFVYVGGNGKSYYSSDGENWLPISGLSGTANYTGVTYGNGRFVCVGSNRAHYILSSNLKSSSATKTWVDMSGTSTAQELRAVTYGNGKFVCVDLYGQTFSSSGSYWSKGDQLGSNTHNSITYGDGKFVIVSNSGKSYYSTNGETWSEMTGLTLTTYMGVTYGNGRFVCVGYYGRSYYSTDGKVWVEMSRTQSNIDNMAVCYSVDGSYDNS